MPKGAVARALWSRRFETERRVAVAQPQGVAVDPRLPADEAGDEAEHAAREPRAKEDHPLRDDPEHEDGDAQDEEHDEVRQRGDLAQEQASPGVARETVATPRGSTPARVPREVHGQGDHRRDEDDLDDHGEERVDAAALRRPLRHHVHGVVIDGLQGERRVAVAERENEGRDAGAPAQHPGHEGEHARRVLAVDDHRHLRDERHEELGDAEEDEGEEVRDEGEELEQQDGERGPST